MKEKVYAGRSRIGLGLFAKMPIEPREVIFYVSGQVVTFEKCKSLPDEGENSFQIGDDAYIDPGFPSRYINHSCEPNAGMIDESTMVAISQIAPGEEICFDYSTALLERYWEIDCKCDSLRCRGKIRDFDRIPAQIQNKYIRLGIVQRFILERVQQTRQLLPPLETARISVE
jgi:hypothetical protein